MSNKLQQAIDAIEAGDKETGKQLLAQLIKANPKSIQAWLLLAESEDDEDLRRRCYQQVLKIHPHNAEAREALGISPDKQARARAKKIDTGSGAVSIILGIAAILVGAVAWDYVSQATVGVSIIGVACLCGILSRIAQAHHQQENLLKMLGRLDRTE